jgi:hypothetical protein
MIGCETHVDSTDPPTDSNYTDYHAEWQCNNSIIKDHTGIRHTDTGHSGHGLSLKSDGANASSYNLIVDSYMEGVNNPVQLRHEESKFNVVKRVSTDGAGRSFAGSIMFRDGANDNVVEQCLFENGVSRGAISFMDTSEEGYGQTNTNNTIRNCIFDTHGDALWFGTIGTGTNNHTNNKIYNNTFITTDLIGNTLSATISGNVAENNIFITTNNGDSYTGITFDHNSFTGGVTPQGTNTSTVAPNLNASYQPQATFTDIDAPQISGVNYDYNRGERASTTTLGAIKHADE